MDFVKKVGIRKMVLFAIVILFALTIFLIVYNKRDYANVYYRTYTKEKGWTKWCINGQTCGNRENTISAIEVKIKSNVKGDVIYKSYYNYEWEEKDRTNGQQSGNKKDEINSIRMKLSDKLKDKYNIKYRIRCTDKQWSVWEDFYGEIFYSEGKNYDLPIKKVQIKLEKK